MEQSDQQTTSDAGTPTATSRSSGGWKERIIVPTLFAGVIGGGAGLVSKHRKALGVANVAATYAANLAIVTGCYCGARELARDARAAEPDDLINSVIGGIASGALLGRLQGGQLGAVRYALIFGAAGTALDFATLQLRPIWQSCTKSLREKSEKKGGDSSWWSLPEWSPIQVLDAEAVAAKRAQKEQLYSQSVLGKLNKEES